MPTVEHAGTIRAKALILVFVFIGIAGLLLKEHYSGPWSGAVHSYGGNVAVSFALYFVFSGPFLHRRFERLLAAGAAFATVQLFEATDGFGVMQNVYDPVDFAANAAGIGLALVVDGVTRRASGPVIGREPGSASSHRQG